MHFVSCKVANQEMCYGQLVLGVIACKYACMLERAYKSILVDIQRNVLNKCIYEYFD